MGEKQPLTLPVSHAPTYRRPSANYISRFLVACIGGLFLYGFYHTLLPGKPCNSRHRSSHPMIHVNAPDSSHNATAEGKVPLEVHIMSKCPDAQVCLKDLVVPAMQDVVDKVDFRLSYIGKVVGDYEVECMHGPDECLGNILELCAAELYPDPKINLGFTMCMTNDYKHIPETSFVQECALEHGIDFSKLNECVSRDNGQHGWDLLRDSVTRSAKADVTKSCTIRLDDKVRCIRDGGEWKECKDGAKPKDLVRDVIAASS